MVNGKSIEEFIDVDLPNIHTLLRQAIPKDRTLSALNTLLENQLLQVLNESRDVTNGTSQKVKEIQKGDLEKHNRLAILNSNKDNGLCLKCKKPCKKRGIQCINGHWIHYYCDKLSKAEIEEYEADEENSMTHTCKICKEEKENNYGEKKIDNKSTGPNTNSTPKVNWDKVDKDLYCAMVEDGISRLKTFCDNNDLETEEIVSNTCQILSEAAIKSAPKKKRYSAKPKLQVWNTDISKAIKQVRQANKELNLNGKPNNPQHPLILNRKECKKNLRSKIRTEMAIRQKAEQQEILETRTYNAKLFHKLINKQRNTSRCFITDLHVNGEVFSGENILHGFEHHFETLATVKEDPEYDSNFQENVVYEYEQIKQLVKDKDIPAISIDEIRLAVKAINTGKSADIHGLVIENILHGGENLLKFLETLVNMIFTEGDVPDILKIGLLTPIFKNKGTRNDSQFYRGITVLPVLGKIIDNILKQRIQPSIEKTQSHLQRGFTTGTSPLNAALILEECYRECKDNNTPLTTVLLDAKSAFDVVDHSNLMRRLYNIGIEDRHWTLIDSMHTNATTSVKWMNSVSNAFAIQQGIRQGGIMSADLYKIYIDPLLHRIEDSNIGMKIGNVRCPTTACADDVTINCVKQVDAQVLINTAYDYSSKQRYKLQPEKSVIIEANKQEYEYLMNNIRMKTVETSTHLGIERGENMNSTMTKTVENNLKKARRTAYSLMSAGLHGETGLDPKTALHIINIYVIPVLTYGLEVILPTQKHINKLEIYQKNLLKQVLSIPQTTADPAPYILSGFLPVEGQIHSKALNMFGNICRMKEDSVEKRLARRQLAVKSTKSASWFIEVFKLIMKYDIGDVDEALNNPLTKYKWKKLINRKINNYYGQYIAETTYTYKTLQYLNCKYTPGKSHAMVYPSTSTTENARIPVKMKILTGTYILQTTRVVFNQSEIDPTCKVCKEDPETLCHFLLECRSTENVRNNIMKDITSVFYEELNQNFGALSKEQKLTVLIDCSNISGITEDSIRNIDYHCRRLIYSLHLTRYKVLEKVPRRRK